MAVSKFCEKQIALNSATLILQKPFFHKKYKTLLILCFNNIFTTSV